jgi:hypothetical protein
MTYVTKYAFILAKWWWIYRREIKRTARRNQADREAKSPCDKNIRYPVCIPGHDSPNGTTFFTIVVYDINRKPPSWMTLVTWSTLVDYLQAESPLTCSLWGFLARRQLSRVIRSLGSSTGAVFLFYHPLRFFLGNSSDSFLISDAVVRTSYYKYFYPKEALISNGVLNR